MTLDEYMKIASGIFGFERINSELYRDNNGSTFTKDGDLFRLTYIDGDYRYFNKNDKEHNLNGLSRYFCDYSSGYHIDGIEMTKEEWEIARIPYIELEKIYGGEEL